MINIKMLDLRKRTITERFYLKTTRYVEKYIDKLG